MSHIIKLSTPGIDVKTAQNKDLVFTSDKHLYKIYDKGEFTIELVDEYGYGYYVGQATIYHNLGYVPDFVTMCQKASVEDEGYYVFTDYQDLVESAEVYRASITPTYLEIFYGINSNLLPIYRTTLKGIYAIMLDEE